jgi:four helix bundle protein
VGAGLQDYTKLKVWEKSHDLTLTIYRVTLSFPREEVYGLTSQMRRSCASVPTNIAEGCGRGGRVELARFLRIAAGLASELAYQLLLAHDLRFLSRKDYDFLTAEVGEVKRMLRALILKLRTEN